MSRIEELWEILKEYGIKTPEQFMEAYRRCPKIDIMYVAEEVSEQGYTDAEYEQMGTVNGEEPIDMTPISQEQRKTLFRMVHQKLGKEDGNALVQAVLAEFNLESTNGMPVSTYSKVMERVMEVLESCDTEPDNTGHEERSAE